MFERHLVQVHFLFLFFFFLIFSTICYMRSMAQDCEANLSHGLMYKAEKDQGGCFSQLRCMMVRSVSSQERRADHGNTFPSSPPLHPFLFKILLTLFWNKTLCYSFYYDFLFNSSFYKEKRYLPFLTCADGTLSCSMCIVY